MLDPKAQLVFELESLMPAFIRRVFVMDGETPLTELPIAQMRLLRLLQEQPNMRVSHVASELGTTPSAVTQMCHRLSASGYLDREDDTDDARGKRIRLSAKGAGLLEERKRRRLIGGLQALESASLEEIEAAVKALRHLMNLAPSRSEPESMEMLEAVDPHPKLA